MRDGADALRAVATGPTRLRAALRRSTGPIRHARDPAAARALQTGFPDEIFGGELLGVLGERLRTLLAPPSKASDEVAALRSALPVARPRAVDGVGSRSRPAVHESKGSYALSHPENAVSSRPSLDLDRGNGSPAADRAPLSGAEAAGEARPPLAGAALLEDRLRRYWIGVQVAAARSFERAPAPRSTRPSALPRGIAEPPAHVLRPRLSDVELARELHAFVTDAPVVRTEVEHDAVPSEGELAAWPPVEAAAPPARRLDVPPRGTPRSPRVGPTGLEPRESAAAVRDLAEQMTAILREQAIRHGIDIA